MELKICIIFISVISMLSCGSEINREHTVISGKLLSSESGKAYLNLIDHFDYTSDEYTIDSTYVSENGEFSFNGHDLASKLVSLTTEKFKPYTYQIYSTAPQTYYFGNCEKFFTSIPTFYITDEKSIKINWFETPEIDSISSPDNSGLYQIKLREFYLGALEIDASALDYDSKNSITANWEEMLIEREYDLKKADLSNIDNESSFDNYLYSEITLGHLNKFLNWIEDFHPENVNSAISDHAPESIYLGSPQILRIAHVKGFLNDFKCFLMQGYLLLYVNFQYFVTAFLGIK